MSYYIYKFPDEAGTREATEQIRRLWTASMHTYFDEMAVRDNIPRDNNEMVDAEAMELATLEYVVYEENLILFNSNHPMHELGIGQLKKMDAQLVYEGEGRPTLSVVLKIPDGPQGESLEREIAQLYVLKGGEQVSEIESVNCPWDQEHFFNASSYNSSTPTDTFYHSDGETMIFSFLDSLERPGRLEEYLISFGVVLYHISLCDPLIEAKADLFLLGDVCPECYRQKLRYLAAELESLPEDLYSCPGCGGIFTRAALEANAPYRRVSRNGIRCIEAGGDSLFVVEYGGEILRMGTDLTFESLENSGVNIRHFVAFTSELWLACGNRGSAPSSVCYTEDGGKVWKPAGCESKQEFSYLVRLPGTEIVILATHFDIFRSQDAGRSCVHLRSVTGFIRHIQIINDSVIFVIMEARVDDWDDDYCIFLSSVDGGRSWRESRLPMVNRQEQLFMLDEQRGLILDAGGEYFLTGDGGEHWENSGHTQYYFEHFLPGEEGLIYAIASRIDAGSLRRLSGLMRPLELLESRNGGRSWTLERSIKAWHFTCALLTEFGDLYLGDGRGVIIKQGPEQNT